MKQNEKIFGLMDLDIDDISNNVDMIDLNDQFEVNISDSTEDEEFKLPNVIIVTNVSSSVFENDDSRCLFESLFLRYGDIDSINYLKSFHRARIQFISDYHATLARIELNDTEFDGKTFKCYMATPTILKKKASSDNLEVPALTKQFLISPPASPPVGWAPVIEQEPILNYDLISAIANLAPGEMHEIHAGSKHQPQIVVHICEDPAGYENGVRIPQTKRP